MNLKKIIGSYGEYIGRLSNKFQDVLVEQNGAFILLIEISADKKFMCGSVNSLEMFLLM
ncbi:hypothetical protein [Carboxydothermus pertinax]|uniref:hypothetical protein n=1 Tax=Carboxydothermus pertinax TaxID=870242 RepID=UPI001356389B|nr:hypothetical protein [Carboxydothermus pertinax]